ncbi:MAG: hypothetical protein OEV44_05045 [Spirochaetota bacterium]|nr:hypothetical protein [Spirochaetota bacterium]
MLKNIIFSFLLSTMVITSLFADQAAYLSKNDAKKAKDLIKLDSVIREYCKPCGDKGWKAIKVKKIEVSFTNYENYYEVKVNNKGVDLAYIYILKDNKWTNLAMILKLSVSNVPEILPDNLETTQEE